MGVCLISGALNGRENLLSFQFVNEANSSVSDAIATNLFNMFQVGGSTYNYCV